jgi:tRNA modification GTPase
LKHSQLNQSTILALATPEGESAIALIRLSGPKAIQIVASIFKGKNLRNVKSQTLHFGRIVNKEAIVDEVLVSVFKAPHTYTGEDLVEISCHGSRYIVQSVLQLCIDQGAETAKPGEFTMRAFLNGKMDLSQAEAVADLIHSQSEMAHKTAMHQLRGGFSSEINDFREKLIHFAALIELELDFSEEDVEFANRPELENLVAQIRTKVQTLIASFKTGNVIKNGVPVVIVGKPNAGKSTLFNQLLKEDRAIVSDIAGTTRDVIEEVIDIHGIQFRLIDPAGIREAKDKIEQIGIDKTYQKIEQSALLLYVFDASTEGLEDVQENLKLLKSDLAHCIVVANHCDKLLDFELNKIPSSFITISAKQGQGIQALKEHITTLFHTQTHMQDATIITNARHADALRRVDIALQDVQEGLLENKTGDLLSVDIRMALFALGEITGAIEFDKDILGTIFGKFCIGK